MGYEGKSLGINGQGIVNPIKVEELSRHAVLGYVRKEAGECAKTTSEPPTTDDEKPSSVLSKLIGEVKGVDSTSISASHSMISIGNVEMPIIGTNMRLLTRMNHEKEEELGVNNQRHNSTIGGYVETEICRLKIHQRRMLEGVRIVRDIVEIIEERE